MIFFKIKTTSIFLILVISSFITSAQTKDLNSIITIGGYISTDASLTTRQTVNAREEAILVLVPKPVVLDNEGNDINKTPSYNFTGINSRLNLKISGPDAFGAKTSGFVEGDFLGISNETKFSFRLRHAYVKLDWEQSQLLVGQYWHPTFITDCFPGIVSFGAGAPFNPLSRNPQFKFTYKLGKVALSFTQLTNGHFANVGAADSQLNALVPELHLQANYKSNRFISGVGIGHKILRPKIVTANNYVTKERVHSNTLYAFAKYTTKALTYKTYGIYGQNNDNLVMMGGYAALNKNYTASQLTKGIVEYTPYNNLSSWVDVYTNGTNFIAGIFAGYSENLGASKPVDVSSYTGRWGNVKNMMRISPRLVFVSGKTSIGTEIEYSLVHYNKANPNGQTPEAQTGYDAYGKVTNYQAANNLKFLLNVTYYF
ncbi:hypothetical protein ACFQ1R_01335 [Mariniflexile jejuense]|uniref:OmpL-like beta-barrel porin-2 n=1 Tax=Mariniflexile jejuense TaxID=1173582 RepID=A0ABW3JE35_9FLAO